MKFKSKYLLKDRQGEERTVRKFLWWPKCFGRKYWRWLEYANIRERIVSVDIGGHMQYGYYSWHWVEVDFDEYS